jgi:hypothetical protein
MPKNAKKMPKNAKKMPKKCQKYIDLKIYNVVYKYIWLNIFVLFVKKNLLKNIIMICIQKIKKIHVKKNQIF